MHDLDRMSQILSSDVDAHCVSIYDDGHREHLGASILGDPCSRKLWYMFRWVKHTVHKANLYRLWNRGHLEESRILAWLRGVGFMIDEYDPTSRLYVNDDGTYIIATLDEAVDASWRDVSYDLFEVKRAIQTGVKRKQLRVSFCGGHAGGSCDGIAWLPPQYEYDEPILLEFKTANKTSFAQLEKEGLRLNKPQHFAQMNIYAKSVLAAPINLGLYICVCKDNDQIYYEFVKLSPAVADSYEQKAYTVINASKPPPKISELAGSFNCRFCDFSQVCHFGQAYDKNCRACSHATPYDNKVWFCSMHHKQLDSNTIARGCDSFAEVR